jgi:hypothetical protein
VNAPDPWEFIFAVKPTDDDPYGEGAAIDAIACGLRSLGYEGIRGDEDTTPEWSWPAWARAVYYALEINDAYGVGVVRAVSGWPEADRDALVAADALGGSDAVRQLLGELARPKG